MPNLPRSLLSQNPCGDVRPWQQRPWQSRMIVSEFLPMEVKCLDFELAGIENA